MSEKSTSGNADLELELKRLLSRCDIRIRKMKQLRPVPYERMYKGMEIKEELRDSLEYLQKSDFLNLIPRLDRLRNMGVKIQGKPMHNGQEVVVYRNN
jgi:hypothetical protein